MEYKMLQPDQRKQIVADALVKLEAQHYANAATIVDLQTTQAGLRARIDALITFHNDPPVPDEAVDTPPDTEPS